MKKLLLFYIVLFGIISCSSDNEVTKELIFDKVDTNTVYVSKSIKYKVTEKRNSDIDLNINDVITEDLNFYSVIISDGDYFKGDESEEEIKLILENNPDMKFSINYFINDVLDISYYYENGKVVSKKSNNNFFKQIMEKTVLSSGCGYEGIRVCANEKLDSSGFVTKIYCAFNFWSCYGLLAGDCAIDNCFNRGEFKLDKLEYEDYKKENEIIKIKILTESGILDESRILKLDENFKGNVLKLN